MSEFCWSLSIALFDSYWRLYSWGHFECASWSFLVPFGVHEYFSSLANGSLWFLLKLLRETSFLVYLKCFLVDGLVTYVTAVLLGILQFYELFVLEWQIVRVFLFGLQHWISTHSQLVAELVLDKIRLSVVFQVLLKLWPIIRFQMGQFPYECSIFVVFIGCIRPSCNRSVAVFSHVGPYSFPCFQKGYIPLVFHLKYFFFFFVNIARSCESRMIFSVVCTSNFFQAIFPHLVRVLFTVFGICLSSSTGFPVVTIFFGIWSTSGELGRTAQLSQNNSWYLPPWEYGAD